MINPPGFQGEGPIHDLPSHNNVPSHTLGNVNMFEGMLGGVCIGSSDLLFVVTGSRAKARSLKVLGSCVESPLTPPFSKII